MVRKNNLDYNDDRREEGEEDMCSTQPNNDGNPAMCGLRTPDMNCSPPSETHFKLVYIFLFNMKIFQTEES